MVLCGFVKDTGQTAAITVNAGQMMKNSGNMTRRLSDAIGRAIAETLNADELGSITTKFMCNFGLELMNI